MSQINSALTIDIEALKTQVDEEIAARLQAEVDNARHIHRRGFYIGDLGLLVPMDVTSEVLEMPPVFRLPGAPKGIKGLVNRHGRVVPVMDISGLFGHQNEPAEKSWLLICGRGEEAVGIIVDSLPERKQFTVEDQISLEEITHPIGIHAKGAYQDEKETWIDLDTEALFGSVFQVDISSA